MPHEEEIRRLLIRHHRVLALAHELALKLLDVVQADAPVPPDTMRESRRFVGDALARIESGESYADGLWETLGIERRRLPQTPVPHERRNARRSKS